MDVVDSQEVEGKFMGLFVLINEVGEGVFFGGVEGTPR